MKYRTIVADPPWPIGDLPAFCGYAGPRLPEHRAGTGRIGLGYETMPLDDIKALPVEGFSERDAHLYLWTINALLAESYEVARSWGFRPVQLLVWAKEPRGMGPGGVFANTTEFILFCRRGNLSALQRVDRTCWGWKRPYSSRGTIGSAKPEGFLDLVEQVSPGPYLEMFARRARFGWDYWGDESLNTAVVS
jgi:N6-adenosine-specific RNA methylase IME4